MLAAGTALTVLLGACGGGGGGGAGDGIASAVASARPGASAAASEAGVASAVTATPLETAADQPYADPNVYSSAADASLPTQEAIQSAAVTHHSITLGGKTVSYTATAGHLLVHAESDGAPSSGAVEASLFYVAYTLDGQPARNRPVTFFWNGGPGSSTIYLHLGGWGPKTLDIDEANLPMSALSKAPQFTLHGNPDTLLGDTDMVFIDAAATGWSEAVAPYHNSDFEGVDADARLIRNFIIDYLRDNGRQMSPKYVYGESYGGIRTPIVARLLLQHGPLEPGAPVLNGLILNSPILSYKSNCYMRWYDADTPAMMSGPHEIAYTEAPVSCEGYIPTYLMVHYAQTHPGASIEEAQQAAWQAVQFVQNTWLPESSAYAATVQSGAFQAPYTPADFPAAQQSAFQAMANATGLTSDEWARDFNMDVPDFFSALLGLDATQWDYDWSRVDRYNAMVRLPATLSGYVAANGSSESWVSGSDYFNGSFLKAETSYMSKFLDYTSASPYAFSSWVSAWNWDHDGDLSGQPQSLTDLYEALSLDPKLSVLIGQGEQDAATPFYQTVLDLQSAGLMSDVSLHLYPGGHMLYLTRASHDAFKTTLDQFYATTTDAP